jgi:hypothetical protein
MKSPFASGLVLSLLFCVLLLSLFSCGDEFSEKDAFEQALTLSQKRDSIQRAEKAQADSVTVNLRLTSFPSKSLISSAIVEIQQSKKIVKQINSDGSLSFKILKANAEMVVKATDHASVRFQYLYNSSTQQSVVFLTLQLPIVTTEDFLTINGTVNAEFDLNAATEYSPVPAGIKIKAKVNSNFNQIVNTLDDPSIAHVTLFDLPIWEVETTTDENGNYSLELPTLDGVTTQYRLELDDFVANQKIAINRFLDANESLGQYSVFGQFTTVEVPTEFTSKAISAYTTNPYTQIPTNIPALRVEVLENPVSGNKTIFLGSVVSSAYESNDNQLSLGRLYRFSKADQGYSSYPSGTLTLKITDLRNGATATTTYNNSYQGSLPTTLYLGANYTYYYGYAISPNESFLLGPSSSQNIASLNTYVYPNNSYTAANSYIQNGSAYARTPKGLSVVYFDGNGFNPFVAFDNTTQRNYILVLGSSGQNITTDISYGTGIKKRPVQ